MGDSVEFCGQYSSIWQKDKTGQWKVMVDLGIDYSLSLFNRQSIAQFSAFTPCEAGDTGLMAVENRFIAAYGKNGKSAFYPYLTDHSWFNFEGQPPLHKAREIKEELEKIPDDLEFIPINGAMAFRRDLAYVYGSVNSNKGKKENYLRVWAHSAKGWFLLLQVLKW